MPSKVYRTSELMNELVRLSINTGIKLADKNAAGEWTGTGWTYRDWSENGRFTLVFLIDGFSHLAHNFTISQLNAANSLMSHLKAIKEKIK